MDRPDWVGLISESWGPPRIAIDKPYRMHGDGWLKIKRGWTWFPGNVNHSVTLWHSKDLVVTGFSLSCHDDSHAQVEWFRTRPVLADDELITVMMTAGWSLGYPK